MPLTALAVRNAKPREKPYKMADGRGLYVLVQPTGGRLWRFDYRFDGKRKTLALGKYPELELAPARDAVEDARRLLRAGTDPSVARSARRNASKAPAVSTTTFEKLAERWHEGRKPAWVQGHANRVWSRLKADILPNFGGDEIATVTSAQVLAALRIIESRGSIETAKRVSQYCSAIFRYARAEGLIQSDPTIDLHSALKAAPPTRGRAAFKAHELPEFLKKLDQYDGGERTKLAIKLVMLTFVRTSELRFAQWDEFEDLEGANPIWRIPGSRMKMRLDHIVPLSAQAVKVISALRELAISAELVFAADTKSGVMSENTMIFALYRMGFHSRATIHGFRSTASTILNERGFNRDWVEKQLAHIEPNEVRSAYNAAEWLRGRRRMMAWWASYLDRQAGLSAPKAGVA